MAPQAAFLFLLAVLLPADSSASARAPAPAPAPGPAPASFDITKILSGYREFSVFSSLLTQTGLARAINGRRVVTVLAPNNTALPAAVRRLPRPLLADLLSLHVVLDHLDPKKLDALRRGNGSVVTTLLKGIGTSRGLRVTGGNDGRVTFSYAGPGGRGSRNNATLVRVVTEQAHSVLVLQVSGLVIPAAVPATTAGPIDITKILSGYPEFSVFSSLLNENGLTKAINGRKVVTVLAPNNTVIPAVFRRLPRELRTYLLELHVVLDYLDPARLDALQRGTTGNGSVIPTLLQGTDATSYLCVVGGDNGRITFSYAGPGGRGPRNNATLVRVVTAQAYSVLVLQVSGLILPSAIPAILASPFDITKILSDYPEFSVFSSLLNETGLTTAINGCKVVTVLAPNNTALPAAVRRLPRPLLADLLALHVVLDYLDPAKLDALRRGTTGNGSVVTTLLKGTGATRGLRVAGGDDGRVTFSYAGSGGRGSRNNATLVKVVTAQAYSVLVLQVSGLVIPSAVPATTAAPFDITKILSDYPEFSAFSSLLNETGLVKAINERVVVTILAPNNTALSDALRGFPPRPPRQLLADVLARHVVLDYLDPERLDALRRGKTRDGSTVTTLLQATGGGGAARGRGGGFLHVTGGENGRITFSSAASGDGRARNATLVRVVTAQAFSVLVLQVSGLVLPPGIVTLQLPRAIHMSLPPRPAPVPAPQYPPVSGSGPLVPSPIMPVPTPNLTNTTPPPSAIIPIPSVHGGVAAKLPEAAGHRAASWWSGAGVALGIILLLLL